MAPNFALEDCFVGTVTVGERGQVVIPAEARKKLGINTGDKLFIISHPTKGGLFLLKIDAMREFLRHLTLSLSMAESNETDESALSDDDGQYIERGQ